MPFPNQPVKLNKQLNQQVDLMLPKLTNNTDHEPVMWIRIRIHLGPWIRIQRYKITDKMKGKAKFN